MYHFEVSTDTTVNSNWAIGRGTSLNKRELPKEGVKYIGHWYDRLWTYLLDDSLDMDRRRELMTIRQEFTDAVSNADTEAVQVSFAQWEMFNG